jgi:hypothetical protein
MSRRSEYLTIFQGNGEHIIEAAAAVCSNTIVVVHSVGPVLIGEWSNNPNMYVSDMVFYVQALLMSV